MIEFRCKTCDRLLAKEHIQRGEVEIRCPKCKTYNTLTFNDFGKKVDTFRPSVYDIKYKREESIFQKIKKVH